MILLVIVLADLVRDSNSDFSSLISSILSTPPLPIARGTPKQTSFRPYSPFSSTEAGTCSFSLLTIAFIISNVFFAAPKTEASLNSLRYFQ